MTAQELLLALKWRYWIGKVYDREHGAGAFKALPLVEQAQIVKHEMLHEDVARRIKEAM